MLSGRPLPLRGVACLALAGLAGLASADSLDRFLSGPFTYAYLGLGVGLPLLRSERQEAYRTADTGLFTAALAEGIKLVVRERRPDGSDLGSFPSIHAATSFAVATMASQFQPQEAPLWYLGAAAIGVSRIRLHKHSILDVLAGAALGYGVARLELSQPHGLLLQPLVGRDHPSLSFSLRF